MGAGAPPITCVSKANPRFDALVAQALRAYDARQQLLGLRARAGERAAAIDIAVRPLGQDYARGAGCVAAAGDDEVTPRGAQMAPGRCFTVEVTNRETKPLYVSALVVDPDLSIKHLFPRRGATDDVVPPGETRDVGTYFTEAPPGDTFFKVIATEKTRVDTRMLEYTPQDLRTRGGAAKRGAESTLGRLLRLRGLGLRTSAVPSPERWGSAEAKLTVVDG
jgi:hypothetical protein